ncbi:hypothetical protein H113_08288, partial [Trichophyton rubrum MR1459]
QSQREGGREGVLFPEQAAGSIKAEMGFKRKETWYHCWLLRLCQRIRPDLLHRGRPSHCRDPWDDSIGTPSGCLVPLRCVCAAFLQPENNGPGPLSQIRTAAARPEKTLRGWRRDPVEEQGNRHRHRYRYLHHRLHYYLVSVDGHYYREYLTSRLLNTRHGGGFSDGGH